MERLRGDASGQKGQVVAAIYVGPAGIDAINTHLHLYNAKGRRKTGRPAKGDPVI